MRPVVIQFCQSNGTVGTSVPFFFLPRFFRARLDSTVIVRTRLGEEISTVYGIAQECAKKKTDPVVDDAATEYFVFVK